jgi:hypothetical protein
MQLTTIQNKIYEVRGQSVMLDFDLAELYEVETRVLKQSVRRNRNRFPQDFMFELTEAEINQMVSQNVIPSKSYLGGASPFAFTEHGVLMLSSVLNTEKAVQTNILIMRVFVQIRNFALNYKELSEKLKELETKYDKNFNDIYKAINYLIQKENLVREQKERTKIGFKKDSK